MSDKSIDKVLEDFLPKSRKIDWNNIAALEIFGKDPLQFLSWLGKDDLLFLPYYDSQDVANLDFLSNFQLASAKNSFSGSRAWLNLPAVAVNNDHDANKISLDHLSFGADGVLFDLHHHSNINLNNLMEKIEWQYCFVAFQSHHHTLLNQLSVFIKNNFDPALIQGALFWESIPQINDLDFYFNYCKNFKALGLISHSTSPALEISESLWQGVKTFESFSEKSTPENIFKSICFSLSVDAGFMESITKIKVLRMLWYQVSQSYGLNDYKIGDLHIHVTIKNTATEKFAPHEGMLKSTFAAMAAILGGCDSLTIQINPDQNFLPRIARNISTILREESFFNKVADPLVGSYALDSMVQHLALKAWSLFQSKWRPL